MNQRLIPQLSSPFHVDESPLPYVCPTCSSRLGWVPEGADGTLACQTCPAAFPVTNGIPILIPNTSSQEFPIATVTETYDRAYRHNGIMGTEFDQEYSRATKTILLDLCLDPPNDRILDVGTGDGHLWNFAPRDRRWYAIDLSRVGVERAVRYHPELTAAVALAEWLPFPDNYFGAVIAADTLEHTFDLQRSLSSIRRALAIGGTFAFSVPTPNSLRTWGYNRLIRRAPSVRFLLKLGWVVAWRTLLFGRPDFQPIDRDLPLDDWCRLIEEAGFQFAALREWPEPPLKPMVVLFAANRIA